jgi:hypothetical protein
MLGAPLLLMIMLVPAVLELRKPKDSGPRVIMFETIQVHKYLSSQSKKLFDLEEPYELDAKLKPLVKVILGKMGNLDV